MTLRQLFPIFLLTALLLVVATADALAQRSSGKKPFTVVIDAGHGGKDAGAVGRMLKEKDLNLTVSLLTGQYIKEKYPEVKVVYTRQTDIFLPLQERANIVNRNNADLFICVHTNASTSPAAHGAETFVLGTEKMSTNLDVAMRENSVIQLETDYKTTYQGFDPRSVDSYIMFELMQNNYMDQSLRYAENVQKQLVQKLHRTDRGVRQAAFWVLLKSACPSVLVEMGFISNPEEERFLSEQTNLEAIAHGLCDAFTNFYRPSSTDRQVQADTITVEPEGVDKQVIATDRTAEQQRALDIKRQQQEEQKAWPYYGVQVCASRTQLADTDPRLKGQKCLFFQANGWYKYYIGPFASEKEAQRRQAELKSLFPDCWVVKIPKQE
ncbi:MAG: N-acetylmuramoyl-L-alanine amidase [Paludibacteraceae bacterium]|nr:N-acetylmuramoyl-L-alanine amidase [Paludibacteraceae bacterium]